MSQTYLESLGAQTILRLPNVAGLPVCLARPLETRGSKLVIAQVGDWSEAKGADLTRSVFARLQARVQSVELLIAGRIVDVPIPSGATYLGYLSRDVLWNELARRGAMFLVLLSRLDRWPLVVDEAMATGLVPVTSPVANAVELIEPICEDLVVSVPEEAAGVIERLYRDPPTYNHVIEQLERIAIARTGAWGADVFVGGLEDLP